MDAQHPHDFLMGLSVQYARPLNPDTMLQFYYAPVGDPALGPVAFPHRASAFEIPQAPLGHHWQDSTHIADNVATVAVRHKWLRLEASGFYGTEPNENRWNIDWGRMNSYSARVLRYAKRELAGAGLRRPSGAAGTSGGRRRGPHHGLAAIFAPAGSRHVVVHQLDLGPQSQDRDTGATLNSWLLETLYPATRRNFLTGRMELVDKDELFADQPAVEEHLARTAGSSFRIHAYTAGYTRDIATIHDIETGIGANVSSYRVPSPIQPYYGEPSLGRECLPARPPEAARIASFLCAISPCSRGKIVKRCASRCSD